MIEWEGFFQTAVPGYPSGQFPHHSIGLDGADSAHPATRLVNALELRLRDNVAVDGIVDKRGLGS